MEKGQNFVLKMKERAVRRHLGANADNASEGKEELAIYYAKRQTGIGRQGTVLKFSAQGGGGGGRAI